MGKISVKELVKRAFEGKFDISVAMENHGFAGKVENYDGLCFYIDGQRIDYANVCDIKAVPTSPHSVGKTIKEKAREAAEDDRQVVVTTEAEGKYTGWITGAENYSFAWEHPLGPKRNFQNDNVRDIRFVGEPEVTGFDALAHVCDTGGTSGVTQEDLLREAAPDELGAENEELKRDNRLLSLQVELSKVRVAALEAGKIERQQEQVIESEREQNDANTINGQSKQIREHVAENEALRERLTVAEAGWSCSLSNCAHRKQCLVNLVHTPGASCDSYVPESEEEPANTTAVGEAPESLLQKLEHARKYGYAVVVTSSSCTITDAIIRIGGYGMSRYGRKCVDFQDKTCVYLDSVTHVEIAYAQSESESGKSPEPFRQALEDARLEQRWVTVRYNDGCEHTGTIDVICPVEEEGEDFVHFDDRCNVPLKSIEHVEVGKVLCAPDEPEDIAKQRWMWVGVGTGEGLVVVDEHSGVIADVDSPAQKKLQAAAPELADRARKLLRGVDHSKRLGSSYPDGYIHLDRLLAKLGVKELHTPGTS